MWLLASTFALSLPKKIKTPLPKLIGNIGCYVPLFSQPNQVGYYQTNEGEEIFFGEIKEEEITYGLLVVSGKKQLLMEPEVLLSDLFHDLFYTLGMKHRSGLISEGFLVDNYCIKTVSEYWQNKTGIDCKAKGFTDGKTMGILYIKNISELSAIKMEGYLNSLRYSVS